MKAHSRGILCCNLPMYRWFLLINRPGGAIADGRSAATTAGFGIPECKKNRSRPIGN